MKHFAAVSQCRFVQRSVEQANVLLTCKKLILVQSLSIYTGARWSWGRRLGPDVQLIASPVSWLISISPFEEYNVSGRKPHLLAIIILHYYLFGNVILLGKPPSYFFQLAPVHNWHFETHARWQLKLFDQENYFIFWSYCILMRIHAALNLVCDKIQLDKDYSLKQHLQFLQAQSLFITKRYHRQWIVC